MPIDVGARERSALPRGSPEGSPTKKGLAMRRAVRIFLVLLTPLSPLAAEAQTVTATVAAGSGPFAVAVNPATNKIYVANNGGTTVTVIDGATNTTATVTAGSSPYAVAVNPVTNKIYVANSGSANVTVIDGATNSTATVTVGSNAIAVAVNPVTNKIYVVKSGISPVTVIDGLTNSTSTVTVGTGPVAVAVNPVTNKIYVANFTSNNVTVIDGATNSTATVAVGTTPNAVAVNPVTNKVYVANTGSANVTVIDGATNSIATVAAGTGTSAVAVNPVTNKIYVANLPSSAVVAVIPSTTVTVIDGATNSTTPVTVGVSPGALAVNPVTNKIYVSNGTSNSVTAIDGATNATATVTDPTALKPFAVAVNPVTDKVYVANNGSANVTVIDGATNSPATVTDPNAISPLAVAVNPVTNKIYVGNNGSANVTVIDGATNLPATVAAGIGPQAVAVNPVTNKIYVANSGGTTVTVIDGATKSTATVAAGNGPFAVDVNPVTNKIYVANLTSANVTVIDGATNTTATVAAGTSPEAVAVNPVTNKIYVANNGSANVTVIDGATNTTATVAAGTGPFAVDVNPATNKIYVANATSGTVTVIDGTTSTTTTVTVGSNPLAVVVNPVTNKIYVANNGSSAVTVIDGATNTTAMVATDFGPLELAVNPVTNKIYVANAVGTVTVIDGATNSTATITAVTAAGSVPGAVAVNPVTNKIYVANIGSSSNNVTVIDEQQVQTIPLQAAITPLAGNTTSSTTPSFSFTASSTFSPTAPTPDNLLFEVDTWQAGWTAATNNGGGHFTGGTPVLQPGFHILYAYSTDGQEATSTNTGFQSSPLISNITAYGFLVAPVPLVSLSASSLTFSSQIVATTSLAQTVTLTNTGNATLSISTATLGGTNPADFTTTADTCSSANVAPNGTCTISVTFTPTATGTRTGTITIMDNAASSPHTVRLTGTGVSAAILSLSTPSLTFGSQLVGTTSAPQTITLTNTGAGSLGILSIGTTGDFGQTNKCGTSLAVNASCTINVTFTPTVPGAAVGQLTITDDAAGSPQTVGLIGTGSLVPAATVIVLGTAGPWNYVNGGLNTNFQYGVGDQSNPTVVSAANGIAFAPGGNITVAYVSGLVSARPDLAPVDANGDTNFVFNNTNPGGLGVAPSFYISSSQYPVYAVELVGVFATSTGTIVGTPFKIGIRGTVTIPAGATQLQLGANDVLFADNTGSWTLSVLTTNPVPLINQPLVPAAAVPGGAQFTLTVNGTGFVSGAVVKWNGSARTTTFVSASQLTAAITAADIAASGTALVTVVNPGPAFGTSNVAFFQITNPTTSVALSKTDFATGTQGFSVAAGDFNGDGNLDLAIANYGSNTVSILLGKPDGTFATKVDYATGTNPTSVRVADFNNDGKLDLAVTNQNCVGGPPCGLGTVSILVGNGDGTFKARVDYAAAPGPNSIAVGDFKGDGKLDLAVATGNGGVGNTVSVLMGNGDATFQNAVNYTAGLNPAIAATADFNGDGKLDLAIVNNIGSVSILLGNGDGTFQSHVDYATGSFPNGTMGVADFNGDGKLDLAIGNMGSGTVSVLLGKGDGTFQPRIDYPAAAGSSGVATGDFNGDGNLDVAAANFNSNTVSILFGKGDGTFQPHVDYATGTGPFALAAGDFNGDGRLDLAVVNGFISGSNTVSILLQAAAPIVSLSGASLTYSQSVGFICPAKSVTLTNIGSSTLSINGIAVTGDFTEADTCGANVLPGASCSITVTFHAKALGPSVSAVTIADNAPGSPQMIALSGTGLPPCGLKAPPQTATVVRKTDSTQFTIVDQSQGCFKGSIELSCAPNTPLACAFSPATIPASGTSALKVSGLAALTADSAEFWVIGNTGSSGGSVPLSVFISDFSFTTFPGTVTVRAGETANYAMTVLPTNKLSGTVSLACGGAPAGATCTLSPASVALDGVTPVQAKVTVQTTARAQIIPGPGWHQVFPPLIRPLGQPWAAGLVVLAALGAMILAARRRRVWLGMAVSILLVLFWAACGGGGGFVPSSGSAGTPPGTYSMTITGTYSAAPGTSSATLSHETKVTLTVN